MVQTAACPRHASHVAERLQLCHQLMTNHYHLRGLISYYISGLPRRSFSRL